MADHPADDAQPPEPVRGDAGAPAQHRVPLPVRLIAIGKGLKSSLFLGAGLAITHLVHAPDLQASLRAWLAWLHVDPDASLIHRAIDAVAGIQPHELAVLGIGSFVYATLYGIEGLGLWFGKTWAEWLTSVSTTLFIPVEIHHLYLRPGAGIACLLVINVLIVVYLVRLVLQRRAQRREDGRPPAESASTT